MVNLGEVVVLCRYLPDPTKSSGELRFWQILRLLEARSRRVTVFAEHPAAPPLPSLVVRPMEDLRSVERADLAFLEFWFMGRYIHRLRRRGIPVVLDSVDVEFVRREREKKVLGISGNYHHLERRREIAAYRAADQVWAVSDADAARIDRYCRRLVVVPNILAGKRRLPTFQRREGVCFVGSYAHLPNVDALRWYRDEILARVADVPHTFVGNAAPPDVARLPGFVGGVDVSATYVENARVSIAPLRYGAGLKGKVLEAMACGTPVVTTPIGDEGYAAGRAGAAIVTDDPREFADAVRRLTTDEVLWKRMSRRGRDLAARFSPGRAGATIDVALDEVLGATRATG